ncbi:MAG: hypothetical protein VX642_06275 [Bdellovibrionota bacterium]|nr:hypothetical protein [Bdellovibrionota bacterium]
MSYTFYKVLHLSSLGFTLISLAAVCFYVSLGNLAQDNPKRKLLAIVHGVALLVVLVSGFGLLARLSIHNMPIWVILKILFWLLFGAYPVLAKKMSGKALGLYFGIGVIFSCAAYLAINKPF